MIGNEGIAALCAGNSFCQRIVDRAVVDDARVSGIVIRFLRILQRDGVGIAPQDPNHPFTAVALAQPAAVGLRVDITKNRWRTTAYERGSPDGQNGHSNAIAGGALDDPIDMLEI